MNTMIIYKTKNISTKAIFNWSEKRIPLSNHKIIIFKINRANYFKILLIKQKAKLIFYKQNKVIVNKTFKFKKIHLKFHQKRFLKAVKKFMIVANNQIKIKKIMNLLNKVTQLIRIIAQQPLVILKIKVQGLIILKKMNFIKKNKKIKILFQRS
ncbi:hypothetical protein TTHERM_001225661 (macronuclear) [Tetrahymena thermophila SB210]|uniref:Uncharacterized protein n=1 Tax=Tetrahymena thermophila (strain SB210) TaxID=312017 RepID=W7XGB4_TETTS|nr:hypothetical protein TTHERM_001225661 [Tetrahymena thermophila SB210]EWS71904.1 hypothetical protein TTHERM_001225661 [Tetrahymena thermophila SB210]|eukprot:XP_012655561.1 hypothetical protein TTHERM_001225661 [Tetrahymena thermophila SB210]